MFALVYCMYLPEVAVVISEYMKWYGYLIIPNGLLLVPFAWEVLQALLDIHFHSILRLDLRIVLVGILVVAYHYLGSSIGLQQWA